MKRRRFLGLLSGGAAPTFAGCGNLLPSADGEERAGATVTPVELPETVDAHRTVAADEVPDDRTVVGERITSESLHFVVEAVARGSFGECFDPNPGHEIVLLTVAMKNVNDGFVNASTFFQIRLRDDEGVRYNQMLLDVTDPRRFDDGRLAPGEVKRGDIAFEVPNEVTGLELIFYYTVSVFEPSDRTRIDLGMRLEEPQLLNQELQMAVHGIGETVSVGGLEVTVDDVSNGLGEAPTVDRLVVNVTVTNRAQMRRQLSAPHQMLLKDGRGVSYPIDRTGREFVHDRSDDRTTSLRPEETWLGRLPYRVPNDVTPLYWLFTPGREGDGTRTFWRLR